VDRDRVCPAEGEQPGRVPRASGELGHDERVETLRIEAALLCRAATRRCWLTEEI
jgi:hypothetical protein